MGEGQARDFWTTVLTSSPRQGRTKARPADDKQPALHCRRLFHLLLLLLHAFLPTSPRSPIRAGTHRAQANQRALLVVAQLCDRRAVTTSPPRSTYSAILHRSAIHAILHA
ncbi:unnamed protein product [Zymoseptoria tritici ST99CH_3D7]|uniref:Uncharacterized protein n=1 Tax=Zymoseptoria tritici (strain ST99CH_3D7) TaxID=1276538 RepID=A0A1X7RW21_ZYMT9|nr:unnamed protein product [Zymoseptoria tritici ST99CH_3D7]